jgi:hypothetical protein
VLSLNGSILQQPELPLHVSVLLPLNVFVLLFYSTVLHLNVFVLAACSASRGVFALGQPLLYLVGLVRSIAACAAPGRICSAAACSAPGHASSTAVNAVPVHGTGTKFLITKFLITCLSARTSAEPRRVCLQELLCAPEVSVKYIEPVHLCLSAVYKSSVLHLDVFGYKIPVYAISGGAQFFGFFETGFLFWLFR